MGYDISVELKKVVSDRNGAKTKMKKTCFFEIISREKDGQRVGSQ